MSSGPCNSLHTTLLVRCFNRILHRRRVKIPGSLSRPRIRYERHALSFYNRLTNEKPVRIENRLSLASHSYIYPLGIAEDVLVEIAGYVYPVDFVILDIKEDKRNPFILGTPFLTTAKAEIRFDKGIITLKSEKNKINFFKFPESSCRVEEKTEDDIDSVAPTNTVSRLILVWEARIKYHKEKEMRFNQWRIAVFDDKCSVSGNEESKVSDERGATKEWDSESSYKTR
ncbi:retrovirus-related pol polyprotein from transposon TNT 1-94 [Tanacetum coccineum]